MNAVTLPHLRRRHRPKPVMALPDQPVKIDVPVLWTACVLIIAGFWLGVLLLAKWLAS